MSNSSRLGSDDSPRLSNADHIDLICDAFEAAWAAGESPRVEDYLQRCDECARERLFAELLLVDREYRVGSGSSATRQHYLTRFPEFAAVIDDLEFATIDERRGGREAPLIRYDTFASGSKIAHFELLEEIGAGASGTVWKACDTELQRIVAVKMPRHTSLTMADRERFRREGQACAQLRHPNIVAVHEVGEVHGNVFLVTEYIDGMDLRKQLSQHRPSAREAAELTAQLAEALHHAHEQGVIHRDLKPANVLIDREGNPHITDFGLAKWSAGSSGMTIDGNILGTPAYMAPEQARGDASLVDRRSDVYGLSALLYEMLTGRPPFQGEVPAIIHKVVAIEPISPRKIDPSIPRDLETICLKGMEKVAARRYASTQEMAVDLRRYLRGVPILARRTSMLERSWRLVRRHPMATAIFFALLSVAAIAGSTILSLQQKNYQLEGKRPVRITTDPPGARVALVPLEEQTGEPSTEPASIIRPSGVTPVMVPAKPGQYLLEAVLTQNDGTVDFSEIYVIVPEKKPNSTTPERNSRNQTREDGTVQIAGGTIRRAKDVIAGMVAVPIDENMRRKNPLLPALLYVDPTETTASDIQHVSTKSLESSEDKNAIKVNNLEGARSLAKNLGKRLPSAAEYDAIVEYVKQNGSPQNDAETSLTIEGLFDGVAEWSTTKYRFHGKGSPTSIVHLPMIILKGFGHLEPVPGLFQGPDGQWLAPSYAESLGISWRYVHSGEPRFVKP